MWEVAGDFKAFGEVCSFHAEGLELFRDWSGAALWAGVEDGFADGEVYGLVCVVQWAKTAAVEIVERGDGQVVEGTLCGYEFIEEGVAIRDWCIARECVRGSVRAFELNFFVAGVSDDVVDDGGSDWDRGAVDGGIVAVVDNFVVE